MKRFYCQCGQEVFFDNTHCNVCGTQLGFDPNQQIVFSLHLAGDVWTKHGKSPYQYRFCEHRYHDINCNWLIDNGSSDVQCLSCQLTRAIPIQTKHENVRRWAVMEAAKRRMIYGLLRLNLPIASGVLYPDNGLIFDFLEDERANPLVKDEFVYSGHKNGVITMNVAEADSSYREAAREAMNESYRTLLGHFRHEIGHYYWQKLISYSDNYADFRRLFGDESVDYGKALEQHYANGPIAQWRNQFISSYASAHPLEDWAETWAHYMLMSETIETALSFGLLPMVDSQNHFDVWMNVWLQLVVVMNALNRSIGHSDAYPFVISETVRAKLKFVHELIHK